MAVFKIINSKSTGHAALKGVLAYVLQDSKTEQHIVSGIGDFITADDQLNAELTYLEYYRIKKLFNKDSGRQYMHAVQSFAKGESDPEQVHAIGQELAAKLWPDHQVLVVTHIDKEHLHNHFVVNSVSYMDSRKLHWKKQDLAQAKLLNDSLCRSEGLSIAEKGLHEDGSKIQTNEQSVYSKKLYHAMKRAREGKAKSYVIECIKAVVKAIEQAISKTDFIDILKKDGWETQWVDKRKYIVFSDQEGHKIRNSKVEKLINIDCSKDALMEQFAMNAKDNDINVLTDRARALREQYIDTYCQRVQAEKKLDEIPVKYTKQVIQRLKDTRNKLNIKDRQIQVHIQKRRELQLQYEQIAGYHPVQKEQIHRQIRVEQQAIEQLNNEVVHIIKNNGLSVRDDIDVAINEYEQEQELIAAHKKIIETLKSEQESLTLAYQELLVRIPDRNMIPTRECVSDQIVIQAESMLEAIEKKYYQVNDLEGCSYHM